MGHRVTRRPRKLALAPALAQLNAAVAAVIESWQPAGLNEEQRAALPQVMPTARAWVAAATPRTPKAARIMLWATTRHCLWALETLVTLEPEIALDPHNVEVFAMHASRHESQSWRHGMRSALGRVGRAVNPQAWAPPRPQAGRIALPLPYELHEELGFILEAQLPGRPHRAGRLWVTAASLGAGLRGPEIRKARVDDVVEMRGGRVGIWVDGDDARKVPVRRLYTVLAREACEAARAAGTVTFITAEGGNAVHSIASRLTQQGLSLTRARNTWLCDHLAFGTELPALSVITGPISMNTLNALVRVVCASLTAEEAAEKGLGP